MYYVVHTHTYDESFRYTHQLTHTACALAFFFGKCTAGSLYKFVCYVYILFETAAAAVEVYSSLDSSGEGTI